MADKKASEKRNFHKNKISQIKSEIEDKKSFEQFSLYELSELSNALVSAHDKFELKCLSNCNDAELEEEKLTKMNEENTNIDRLCIKLKAKLKKRIDQLKSGEKADGMEKGNEALVETKKAK